MKSLPVLKMSSLSHKVLFPHGKKEVGFKEMALDNWFKYPYSIKGFSR
jgi:hypothetical protein